MTDTPRVGADHDSLVFLSCASGACALEQVCQSSQRLGAAVLIDTREDLCLLRRMRFYGNADNMTLASGEKLY